MKLSNIVSETEMARLSELVPPAPAAAPATGLAQTTQDPAAQAKMMAQQALDRANRKKAVQDQIRQKQQELADLQKQLATIR